MSEVWTTGDGQISVTANQMMTPDEAEAFARDLLSCAGQARIEAAS